MDILPPSKKIHIWLFNLLLFFYLISNFFLFFLIVRLTLPADVASITLIKVVNPIIFGISLIQSLVMHVQEGKKYIKLPSFTLVFSSFFILILWGVLGSLRLIPMYNLGNFTLIFPVIFYLVLLGALLNSFQSTSSSSVSSYKTSPFCSIITAGVILFFYCLISFFISVFTLLYGKELGVGGLGIFAGLLGIYVGIFVGSILLTFAFRLYKDLSSSGSGNTFVVRKIPWILVSLTLLSQILWYFGEGRISELILSWVPVPVIYFVLLGITLFRILYYSGYTSNPQKFKLTLPQVTVSGILLVIALYFFLI